MSRPVRVLRALCALVALLPAGHAVLADDHRRGPAAPPPTTYVQECAACHVAFPARMLPSDSWRRLLDNLPRHYGTDASLDAATVKELATWLSANAGTDRRVREAPREDRITNSAWFIRKHDEVPAAVWRRPAVNSAANCSACHAQAAQGDFDEHSVRIPR